MDVREGMQDILRQGLPLGDLGEYTIHGVLGSGGFSHVVLSTHNASGERMALKLHHACGAPLSRAPSTTTKLPSSGLVAAVAEGASSRGGVCGRVLTECALWSALSEHPAIAPCGGAFMAVVPRNTLPAISPGAGGDVKDGGQRDSDSARRPLSCDEQAVSVSNNICAKGMPATVRGDGGGSSTSGPGLRLVVAPMPLMRGDLAGWLHARGQGAGGLEDGPLARRVLQMAAGLAAVHAAGYVHGDVKLDNWLVHPADGRLCLADFGLARPITAAGAAGRVSPMPGGVVGGSIWAHSPQLLSGLDDGPAGDWWALGVAVYQLAAGDATAWPFKARWWPWELKPGAVERAVCKAVAGGRVVTWPQQTGRAMRKLIGGLLHPELAQRWGLAQLLAARSAIPDGVFGDVGAAHPALAEQMQRLLAMRYGRVPLPQYSPPHTTAATAAAPAVAAAVSSPQQQHGCDRGAARDTAARPQRPPPPVPGTPAGSPFATTSPRISVSTRTSDGGAAASPVAATAGPAVGGGAVGSGVAHGLPLPPLRTGGHGPSGLRRTTWTSPDLQTALLHGGQPHHSGQGHERQAAWEEGGEEAEVMNTRTHVHHPEPRHTASAWLLGQPGRAAAFLGLGGSNTNGLESAAQPLIRAGVREEDEEAAGDNERGDECSGRSSAQRLSRLSSASGTAQAVQSPAGGTLSAVGHRHLSLTSLVNLGGLMGGAGGSTRRMSRRATGGSVTAGAPPTPSSMCGPPVLAALEVAAREAGGSGELGALLGGLPRLGSTGCEGGVCVDEDDVRASRGRGHHQPVSPQQQQGQQGPLSGSLGGGAGVGTHRGPAVVVEGSSGFESEGGALLAGMGSGGGVPWGGAPRVRVCAAGRVVDVASELRVTAAARAAVLAAAAGGSTLAEGLGLGLARLSGSSSSAGSRARRSLMARVRLRALLASVFACGCLGSGKRGLAAGGATEYYMPMYE